MFVLLYKTLNLKSHFLHTISLFPPLALLSWFIVKYETMETISLTVKPSETLFFKGLSNKNICRERESHFLHVCKQNENLLEDGRDVYCEKILKSQKRFC